MALTLIPEDGTGKVDSNSYASAADGDTYHAGHLYATAWTAATVANREIALVMATRLINAEYSFHGYKTSNAQALQWPRDLCLDPDRQSSLLPTLLVNRSQYLDNNTVPKSLVDATCELARELILTDRTAAPLGEGIKYSNVGSTQTGYDKTDRRPTISHLAQALLGKYGTMTEKGSGSVKLVRG